MKPFKTLQAARAKARQVSEIPMVIPAKNGFYAVKTSNEYGYLLYGPSGSLSYGQALKESRVRPAVLATRIS